MHFRKICLFFSFFSIDLASKREKADTMMSPQDISSDMFQFHIINGMNISYKKFGGPRIFAQDTIHAVQNEKIFLERNFKISPTCVYYMRLTFYDI